MDNIYIGMKPFLHEGSEAKHYDNSQLLLARTLFSFPTHQTLQWRIVQTNKKQKLGKVDSDNIHEPRP